MLPGYPGVVPGAYYSRAGAASSMLAPVAPPLVKLRGLPFRCEEADVQEFLHGLDVVQVLFVRKDKLNTGEAFVLFGSSLHADMALQRNKMYLGRRYVEVFKAKKQEWYLAIANEVEEEGGVYKEEVRQPSSGFGREAEAAGGFAYPYSYSQARPSSSSLAGSVQAHIHAATSHAKGDDHTGVLRMRGLPFTATIQDVVDFFAGFPLSQDSIHIVVDVSGRPTGEAFVEFSSSEDSRHAMTRDRNLMGRRYIELYPSSREEATRIAAKASTPQ